MNRKNTPTRVLSIILLVICSAAAIEAQPISSVESNLAVFPFEIYIANELKPIHLTYLVANTQEEFFRRYNELNGDIELEVYCYHYPQLSFHDELRFCGTASMIIARGDPIARLAGESKTSNQERLSKILRRNVYEETQDNDLANPQDSSNAQALLANISYYTDSDRELRILELILLRLMTLSNLSTQ